eukprot:7314-Heterococcus_DN1.PRE.9
MEFPRCPQVERPQSIVSGSIAAIEPDYSDVLTSPARSVDAVDSTFSNFSSQQLVLLAQNASNITSVTNICTLTIQPSQLLRNGLKRLCHCTNHVIMCHFEGRSEPPPPFPLDVTCPFFVSWEKQDRGSSAGGKGSLRGCIGTLAPQPLARLRDYARSSAFNDRRFSMDCDNIPATNLSVALLLHCTTDVINSPIAEREMQRLKCSVSLLVEYEDAEDCHDWEVGKHGILISFTDKSGTNYSATYLPEVAHEQGWTKGEALESLVRKSGYTGGITRSLLARIELTRYQSSKCGLQYAAYTAMRSAATSTSAGTSSAAAAASSSSSATLAVVAAVAARACSACRQQQSTQQQFGSASKANLNSFSGSLGAIHNSEHTLLAVLTLLARAHLYAADSSMIHRVYTSSTV